MKRQTLIRAAIGTLLAGLLALPIFLFPVAGSAATTVSIKADNFEYSPDYRRIRPGDSVRWFNPSDCQNCANHTVTFTNGPAINEEIAPGEQTSTYTFNSAGRFFYYCQFHGQPGSGMAGTIEVTSGSTSTATTTATGTITRTITQSATPRRTRTRTATATPTRTTASPSPSPTTFSPSPTPTTFSPTPTEPTDTGSAIAIDETDDTTPTGGTSNAPALIAVGGVIVLGILGFLIYRRTLSGPDVEA